LCGSVLILMHNGSEARFMVCRGCPVESRPPGQWPILVCGLRAVRIPTKRRRASRSHPTDVSGSDDVKAVLVRTRDVPLRFTGSCRTFRAALPVLILFEDDGEALRSQNTREAVIEYGTARGGSALANSPSSAPLGSVRATRASGADRAPRSCPVTHSRCVARRGRAQYYRTASVGVVCGSRVVRWG
jgi:hypothetical protein